MKIDVNTLTDELGQNLFVLRFPEETVTVAIEHDGYVKSGPLRQIMCHNLELVAIRETIDLALQKLAYEALKGEKND